MLAIVSIASWQTTKGIGVGVCCGMSNAANKECLQRSSSLYSKVQCCGLESEVHGSMTAADRLIRLSTWQSEV